MYWISGTTDFFEIILLRIYNNIEYNTGLSIQFRLSRIQITINFILLFHAGVYEHKSLNINQNTHLVLLSIASCIVFAYQ